MLQKIPTRPEPSADEAIAYILDTILVLARLAADAGYLSWSAQLRTIFKDHVDASHREWLIDKDRKTFSSEPVSKPPRSGDTDSPPDFPGQQVSQILALAAEAKVSHPDKAT